MTASPRESIKISHATRLLVGLTLAVMFFHFQNKPCNFIFNDESSPKKDAQEKETDAPQDRPFPMPIHGGKFEIFQPLYDMDESKKNPQLLLSPKEFLGTFEERISWAKSMVQVNDGKLKDLTSKDHAAIMYIEMIKSFVSGRAFRQAELSVGPRLRKHPLDAGPFNEGKRDGGNDWTFAGDTMTGSKRLDNVHTLLKDVIENNIPGDYIETGVWRGGSSVLAKAVLEVLDPNSNRNSYVCDSFMGLPPGDKKLAAKDAGWDNTPYLEVASEIVANNFIKYGLLDSNVIFAKGFFNETMPPLAEKITTLSIMRLDGDMYESTVDVLYHLYDKLSIGGYVIMDDWFGFPSKLACEDFFAVHGFQPDIIPIDGLSAYWRKTEDVEIQYWRYEQSKFTL
mmetsp:Transcript_23599/g.33700  ORF Transcript_23599/g.33700 Transcript_23599/m.33700 type:complete len:396 (-) Transcript_23599:692-1879(-)